MDSGHWVALTLTDGKEVLVNLAHAVVIERYMDGSSVRFSTRDNDRVLVMEAPIDVLREKKIHTGPLT